LESSPSLAFGERLRFAKAHETATMTALASAVNALRSAFETGAPFADAFNAVIRIGESASLDDKDQAIGALLAPLADKNGRVHVEVAGQLCVVSGALVEMGGSTRIGFDAILDALADGAAILASSGSSLEGVNLDSNDSPPRGLALEERRWVSTFKFHVVGAMARLARDVECRKRARAHPRLDGAVRDLEKRIESHHVHYLIEILDMLDDEPLLVVDLQRARITRLRVMAVRNGFHLMTLLDGKDPFALVRDGLDSVTADHGYFTWPAIDLDGNKFVAKHHGHILWGEMRALDLLRFEGVRAVLRTHKTFASRGWAVSLVAPIHDALRESLAVEAELSRDESLALMKRMLQTALQPRS
jgi:hypothetical protein